MTLEEPLRAQYTALAAAACPPYDEMLVALEREFRAVDGPRVATELDERARPLFGLAGAAPADAAAAIADAATAALPGEGDDPRCWMLASGLESGRGVAPLRAALAVELGRRAGLRTRPVRMRGCWMVAVHAGGVPAAAAVGPDETPSGGYATSGCLCAHELAFALLGGLAEAWLAAGYPGRARRAAGLRLLLPIDEELRESLREELHRFDRAT